MLENSFKYCFFPFSLVYFPGTPIKCMLDILISSSTPLNHSFIFHFFTSPCFIMGNYLRTLLQLFNTLFIWYSPAA